MPKWACMAVRSISYRKAPLRRVTLSQFGIRSASTKAGALRGLGQAVHAWDATSSLCAPGRRRAPSLLTPSERSHTYGTYCGASRHPSSHSMPNDTNMGAEQADP